MIRNNLYILFLVLFVIQAGAQPKVSAEVKIMLDSAKAHQKDVACIDFLLKAEALAQNDDYSKAFVYQRIGSYYYSRQPLKCIGYQKQAFALFQKVNEQKQAAMCLHSIGFAYEEQLKDVKSASGYISQAIELHKAQKDTMELANMEKYLGMLDGRLGQYAEGKQQVRSAIAHFKMLGYKSGIAVSYFDLAKIFTEQKAYDSALHYLTVSKKYWAGAGATGRVFNINNELLKVNTLAARYNDAHNLLLENEKILYNTNVYYTDKLMYFKNSSSYYNAKHNTGNAQTCYMKYSALRDSLIAKGINID